MQEGLGFSGALGNVEPRDRGDGCLSTIVCSPSPPSCASYIPRSPPYTRYDNNLFNAPVSYPFTYNVPRGYRFAFPHHPWIIPHEHHGYLILNTFVDIKRSIFLLYSHSFSRSWPLKNLNIYPLHQFTDLLNWFMRGARHPSRHLWSFLSSRLFHRDPEA